MRYAVLLKDKMARYSLRILHLARHRILAVATALWLALVCPQLLSPVQAGDGYPGAMWERAGSPQAFGWSVDKLAEAKAYSSMIGSAAVMIVENGIVIDQWGHVSKKYNIHSIRKSILSALMGIHVHEGSIDLKKTLADLEINDKEPLSSTEMKATVLDLLKARSGVYLPALYETASMKALRPKRGSHLPGSFWYYNNWDFNVLGAIFERETKAGIFDEVQQHLAGPLQMEDYSPSDGKYFEGPESIYPAYPIRMSARDMARFGLLYLRGGEWRGKTIVPREWVHDSVQPYSVAGQAGGYGYMWWTSVNGQHFPGVQLDNAFSAQGAGGHYIVVIPERDLVVVHRVDTDTPGENVTPSEFGRLLRIILDAKLTRIADN